MLDNLVEANMMTEGQVFGARRHPATPVDRRDDRAPNYYLDWAFDEMKKLVDTFPKSMTERVFVVRTALDTSLQNNADAAVESRAVKNRSKSELLFKALEEGHFSQEDRFLPGMNKIGNNSGALNGGHVFNLDPLDIRSLSDGMVFGRKLALEYESFFREYVPGCEQIEHIATAPVMGIRDSRRIVGEFELTIDDFRARRQFADQIAVYNRPTDVHPTNTWEDYDRFMKDFHGKENLGRGGSVGIPYSILVPQGMGKPVGGGPLPFRRHEGAWFDSGAVGGLSDGAGHGTAAVQSIETGQPACDLNTEVLVTSLRSAGAYLPQVSLSATMTR